MAELPSSGLRGGGTWDVGQVDGNRRTGSCAGSGTLRGGAGRGQRGVAGGNPGGARARGCGRWPGAARGERGGVHLPGKAAGAELLLHDFDFNGDPVTTDKMHLRQVAPGVVEITSVAWEVGYWRFSVRDAASYFGLGERFDTLDHAHTVVKNLSTDNEGVKGLVQLPADSVLHEHQRLRAVGGHHRRGDLRPERERQERNRRSM